MNASLRRMFWSGMAVFLLSNSPARAEQALEGSIAQRVLQQGSLEAPFQVTLSESGRIGVEAGSLFTEGEMNPGSKLPQLVSNPKAIGLPSWVTGESWQGTARVALEVREDGTVGETMVMRTSGNGKLDRLAEEMVRQWRFEPALSDGKPVLECIQIQITFEPKA